MSHNPADPRQETDVVAHGSAGIANQARPSNIEIAAREYGRLAERARQVRLNQQYADYIPPTGEPHDVGPGTHDGPDAA